MEVSLVQDSSPLMRCELSCFPLLTMQHDWETIEAALTTAKLFN